MVQIPLTFAEIGKTGLMQWQGMVTETYTSKLQWPEAYSVYDEMRRRDPTIRTMWNALVMLARTATWYFEPESNSATDRRAADFLDSCLHDMSHTPEDAIEDALTCVPFGWSWLVTVYKRRQDGLVGWRKWAVRRQSSFRRWEFDETGGVQAMVQAPAPAYEEIELPITQSLHFTFQRDGNNPEGLALLESLYEPWYYLKNLQIVNGIGWQRTFVGLPVFEYQEAPSADDKTAVQTTGEALSVDAKQWVSTPENIKFRLESVSNSSAEALLHTIQYYRLLMMQTLLADFINLGTGQTGSWALGSDKSQLFLMAVDGTLDRIASVINRFGVSRLLDYNQRITGRARLTHTRVEKPALGQLGNWLQQVGDLLTWTPEDETWIRKRTGMPSLRPTMPPAPAPELMAQFAAYDGRDRERAEAEAELLADVRAFLDAQQERVAQAARGGRQVAEDDGFWQREAEAFRAAFLGRLTRAVNALLELVIDDTREQLGGGADWAGVNAEAAAWAREYVGELIVGITETTREAVRQAVQNWIETGAELGDLEQTLAPVFGERRAQLIAATEVTRAYDEANELVRQRLGLPSAEKRAPAHPRCRCATRPVLLPNGEWVVVWYTVRGDRVCKQPLETPWGRVAGCRKLHGMVVSENYGGMKLSDARAMVR
jgi:hypothetical protein